jgi:Zn-finger nucleic acid-binding protein
MKCPNCNETLLMTERNSVEIDYCPSCRGVWLDKGELDKMLEMVEQKYGQPNTYNAPPQQPDPYYKQQDPYYKQNYPHGHKHHKKKSFLGDFFDFD